MRYKATPHEVCGVVTQIASDVGLISNSRNDPTFHDPPTNSNHPAEPFLSGMIRPADLCVPGCRVCIGVGPGYPGPIDCRNPTWLGTPGTRLGQFAIDRIQHPKREQRTPPVR